VLRPAAPPRHPRATSSGSVSRSVSVPCARGRLRASKSRCPAAQELGAGIGGEFVTASSPAFGVRAAARSGLEPGVPWHRGAGHRGAAVAWARRRRRSTSRSRRCTQNPEVASARSPLPFRARLTIGCSRRRRLVACNIPARRPLLGVGSHSVSGRSRPAHEQGCFTRRRC
jgi:hypothetical protein